MALGFGTHAHRSHPQDIEPLSLTERREDDPMTALERSALAAGRIIFGGYFVYNGIRHFAYRDMLIGYAKSKGVRWPKLAVLGSGAMIVVGGLSLLTGVKPKVGAALVTGFLTGVTPRMHDYWNATDQTQRMNEMVNFTKNLALIGGQRSRRRPCMTNGHGGWRRRVGATARAIRCQRASTPSMTH